MTLSVDSIPDGRQVELIARLPRGDVVVRARAF